MILEVSQIIGDLRESIDNVWTWIYAGYSTAWLGSWRRRPRLARTQLPTYNKRTRIHDLALVVEKRELWFSRQLLCLHSPYLNALLIGNSHGSKNGYNNSRSNSKNENNNRLPIQGLSYDEVLRLLWCLTPGEETFMRVDSSNVLALGRASDRLEVGEVSKRCRQFLTQQSLQLVENGDPRVMDLLVAVGELGYRPLLDYLICKAADMMSFKQIERRCDELPPTVLATLYDLKLRGYNRWCHEWRCTSSIKPDEYCDCGEEPFDSAHRCRKCTKICCDDCYESNGLGAANRCDRCSECGGIMQQQQSMINAANKNKSVLLGKKLAVAAASASDMICRCRPRTVLENY